jgi:hypothetical protein
MEFPEPRSTALEAVLSLQHIFRVARAVNVDPLIGFEAVVAFIVDERDVQVVAETWKLRFYGKGPVLAIIVVKGLPRDARVEWHIVRCQKSTEDERSSKTQVAFSNDEAITAIDELRDRSGLCTIYGSGEAFQSLKARYPNISFQLIPSTAVYSVIDKVERHRSCTIIISG